jgi:hypothetical protein
MHCLWSTWYWGVEDKLISACSLALLGTEDSGHDGCPLLCSALYLLRTEWAVQRL